MARLVPAAMSDRVPLTVGSEKLPPAVPPLQVWVFGGPVVITAVAFNKIELVTKVIPLPPTSAGSVSVIVTPVAVAEPVPLATEIQYSTIAPGIAFGRVVPLTGSLTIRLDLNTEMFAAATS